MLCMLSKLDAIVLWGSAGRRLWGVIGDCPKAMTGIAHALFWNCCFTRYGGEFDLDLASCLPIV